MTTLLMQTTRKSDPLQDNFREKSLLGLMRGLIKTSVPVFFSGRSFTDRQPEKCVRTLAILSFFGYTSEVALLTIGSDGC